MRALVVPVFSALGFAADPTTAINEAAINWNAPLVFLPAGAIAESH